MWAAFELAPISDPKSFLWMALNWPGRSVLGESAEVCLVYRVVGGWVTCVAAGKAGAARKGVGGCPEGGCSGCLRGKGQTFSAPEGTTLSCSPTNSFRVSDERWEAATPRRDDSH